MATDPRLNREADATTGSEFRITYTEYCHLLKMAVVRHDKHDQHLKTLEPLDTGINIGQRLKTYAVHI